MFFTIPVNDPKKNLTCGVYALLHIHYKLLIGVGTLHKHSTTTHLVVVTDQFIINVSRLFKLYIQSVPTFNDIH